MASGLFVYPYHRTDASCRMPKDEPPESERKGAKGLSDEAGCPSLERLSP